MPTFVHGRFTKVYLNSYDWTGWFNQSSKSGTCQAVDVSTYGSNDRSYLAGLVDARVQIQGFLTAGTADPDAVLTGLLGGTAAPVIATLWPFGDAAGTPGWGVRGLLTRADVTTPSQGAVGHNLEIQSSVGWEELISLRALALQTGAGTVPAVDFAASGTAPGSGYTAYVQVMTGTCSQIQGTVTIESSATIGGAYTAHGTAIFSGTAPGTVPGGLAYATVDIPPGVVVNRWVRVNPVAFGTATLAASIRR